MLKRSIAQWWKMKPLPRWLEALLTPAITSQENYYRQLGLRDRILNLPLMVAPAAKAFRRATAEKLAGGANLTVARRGWSHGTDKNVSEGRFSMV